MEWLAGQPALGKTSDQFYCPECTWYKMIFDVIRVYIPASSYAFLSLRTYTRYQCISHFLRMIQDFLTKLNGKWRHNQRPYVSRPNEVYILGHILALAYWKLHYRGPHSYARSKLTIYGIFFNLECFFFIWKCFFFQFGFISAGQLKTERQS